MPGHETLSEIGYTLLGRPSIFMLNGILLILCVGSVIIYFNLFGIIGSSLMQDLLNDYSESFFFTMTFYILLLGIILLPLIFFRTIKEMKIISILLFTSIGVFVLTCILFSILESNNLNPDDN